MQFDSSHAGYRPSFMTSQVLGIGHATKNGAQLGECTAWLHRRPFGLEAHTQSQEGKSLGSLGGL